MLFDSPTTITDALKNNVLKRVLSLSPDIGSQDLEKFLPAQIKEKAFFSARTPYVDYLSQTQSLIGNLLQPDLHGSGESVSPAQVRAKMKQHLEALNYSPAAGEQGSLTDLSSDRRTNLIINTQLAMSRGYGNWRQAQDSTVLDLWPADELYRAIQRKVPREWDVTWNNARDELGEDTSATEATSSNGPFVALKNDPIWAAISRFGNPYPPFDYESGMNVRNVSRARAEALGVLAPDESVPPVQDSMNQPYAVSMQDIGSGLADALQSAFGPARSMLQGDQLHILPDPVEAIAELFFRSSQAAEATASLAFVPPAVAAAPGATFALEASTIRTLQAAGVPDATIKALPDLLAQASVTKSSTGLTVKAAKHTLTFTQDPTSNRFLLEEIL